MFVYLTTPRSQNTFVVRVFGDLPFQQRHDSSQKKKKTAYISLQRYVAPTEMNVNNKCKSLLLSFF